jgi:hypothetical protein
LIYNDFSRKSYTNSPFEPQGLKGQMLAPGKHKYAERKSRKKANQMKYTALEVAAIEQFAIGVTIPILHEINQHPDATLLATGTLFKIGSEHFVITARHVFDDCVDPKKIAYPEAPKKGSIYTFGKFDLIKPTESHIDVAAMHLKDVETIKRLNATWQFLSLVNIAMPRPDAPDGTTFVAGYPVKLTGTISDFLAAKFVTAYTQQLPVTPVEAESPVVAGLDYFFEYARTATTVTGAEINAPELPGVSGASVWQEHDRWPSTVWTPETSFRVIGVQSAYLHSKYIRVKSWTAVAKVLTQVDPKLALTIKNQLGIE